MTIGGFASRAQLTVSAVAVAVSATMLLALPDIWTIVHPPPGPPVVAPSSPSPYQVWVSLETSHPEDFYVVLESDFWANRRAPVAAHEGANASVRAEMRLNRLDHQTTREHDSGTVWVERRRRFLTREFVPGARVGRYSLAYVTSLGHE